MKFLSTNEISQVGGGYNMCYEQVTCQYFVDGGTYTLAAGNSKLCPDNYVPETSCMKDLRKVRAVTNSMKRNGDSETIDTVLSATYFVNIC